MFGLTFQQAVIGGAILAGLSLVRTFCWTWRHRSSRKTQIALEREQRETQVALEREQRETLIQAAKALEAASHPSPQAERLVIVTQERAQSNGKDYG